MSRSDPIPIGNSGSIVGRLPDGDEDWDDHYRRHGVAWTQTELAARWTKILASYDPGYHQSLEPGQESPIFGYRGSPPAIFQLRELGYDWADDGAYSSTEVSGTVRDIWVVKRTEARDLGSAGIAERILEITKDWPGWRTFRVVVDGNGTYGVSLYGGKRDWTDRESLVASGRRLNPAPEGRFCTATEM